MSATQAGSPVKMWSGTLRVLIAESLILPTGLLSAAYLTRRLGPDLYGLLILVSVLIAQIEWGLTSIFSRMTIKLAGQSPDWRSVGALALRLSLVASLACTLLIWVFADWVAHRLHEPELRHLLRLLSLDIPFFCVAAAHRDLLIGTGAFRERAVGSAWRWISRLALVVVLVEVGLSVEGALMGVIVSSAVELVATRYYIRPSLFRKTELPVRETLIRALPLFLFALSMQVFERLDLILLKAMGGSREQAGFLGAAQNLTLVPGLFALSFSPLLLSTLSRQRARGDGGAARRTLRGAFRLTFGLLPLAALAAGCAPEVISLLFGTEFESVAPVFSILVFGAGGFVVISVATASLTAAGRLALIFWITGPMVPLGIVAHYFVIPRWGMLGAATVTTVGTLLGALATLVAAYRIWRVAPPLLTSLRSLAVSGLVYLVSTQVVTFGVMILVELSLLTLLIPIAFKVFGEFAPGELERVRGWLLARIGRENSR